MVDRTAHLRSIRTHLIIGIAAVFALAGGVGGWAATTQLSGAVIAQGQVVVDSDLKKVQHPTGGIIGELNVRDGDHVKAGELLARLDDTQTRANLMIVSKGLDELVARQAREEAERDGATAIDFPADLTARMNDVDVAKAVNGEQRQFETREKTRDGQKGQLKERITQLHEEIRGYTAQIDSKDNQIEWIGKELEGVNELWSKGLVPYTRVTTLEREKERLAGERGQLVAAIAQSKGKIAETELQILQVDQDMRTEVGKDLGDIRAKIAELREKKVAAEDQLKRIDIRAPQEGIVHELSVHTVGGVVTQGEPIMLIVPTADLLDVEVKVQPQDIDQLHLGQMASMRFSAFNQRTTPELNGQVSRISADVSEDKKTGAHFYTVRITILQSEISRLGGLKLVPGMPVEAFIQTTPRTVLTYIIRPLHDQIARTFREK